MIEHVIDHAVAKRSQVGPVSGIETFHFAHMDHNPPDA
jgi:hypothetical protein